MGWFTTAWGPEYYFKRASDAINRWWDSIEGQQALGETLIREFGSLSIILCPSPGAMRSEYKARHGVEMPPEAAGMTWSDGTRWEIYLPYKTTKAGNRVVNPWALGHELAHTLPVSNPDNVDKAEFY
jgi:hypothetical protein